MYLKYLEFPLHLFIVIRHNDKYQECGVVHMRGRKLNIE